MKQIQAIGPFRFTSKLHSSDCTASLTLGLSGDPRFSRVIEKTQQCWEVVKETHTLAHSPVDKRVPQQKRVSTRVTWDLPPI